MSAETSLRLHAVEDDTILWEHVEPLASEPTTDLDPGENHSERATVDFEMVAERVQTIREQLGAPGTIRIRVVTTMGVEGEVAGESVSDQHESMLRFHVTRDTFRAAETQTVDEQHMRFETTEVVYEPTLLEQVLSVAILVLSIAALTGLLVARQRDVIALGAEEEQLLEIRQQEQEFSEWINRGTFPAERDYEVTVLVEDLEGLVDVAVDSNCRASRTNSLALQPCSTKPTSTSTFGRINPAAAGWSTTRI